MPLEQKEKEMTINSIGSYKVAYSFIREKIDADKSAKVILAAQGKNIESTSIANKIKQVTKSKKIQIAIANAIERNLLDEGNSSMNVKKLMDDIRKRIEVKEQTRTVESQKVTQASSNEAYKLAGRVDATSKVKPVSIAEQLGIKRIEIPKGVFIFQRHEGVNNNGYRIAETPFTNGQFRALMNMKPAELKNIIKDPMKFLLASLKVSAEENPDKKEKSPLVNINQREATAIAKLIGMRLPTELERERAAAYTDGRKYPWGNIFDVTRVTFNDKGTRSVYAHPKGASHEGVLDLAGNVWEWTSTPYGKIDFTDPNNPVFSKESEYYSLRGGSWSGSNRGGLTASNRGDSSPESRNGSVGFRPAEDLK